MEDINSKSLILVVDDNPKNIQLVCAYLQKNDYDIAIAMNGEKAINIAKSRRPCLILLDIMMPEMSGYEVCEILKNDDDTKDIPVIFLTAITSNESIIKGFESGAVDYISKPFNAGELIARVNTHIKLQQYKQQIINDRNKLEKLNFEKNHFLNIATHDLKNPIFSISMLSKVLRDENLNQNEVKEFSHDIITISEKMLELIRNILDINAIEIGNIKVDLKQEEVFPYILEVYESYVERASKKNIELIFLAECHEKAVFDKSALTQIADNLISNAIKFSAFNKKVYIKLFCNESNVSLSVLDEGPGISEEDQTKLFGKFTKLSAIPTANESSTGLGLSIAKKYAQLINSNLYCKSILGNGAEFILEIPKS